MLQAGISKDVLKAYIETAQVAPPSAADLVTLKERGAPDELTLALVKRGAELTAQANQASASNATPARVSGTVGLNELLAAFRSGRLNSGYLDPEGYDYFRVLLPLSQNAGLGQPAVILVPNFPVVPGMVSWLLLALGLLPAPVCSVAARRPAQGCLPMQ